MSSLLELRVLFLDRAEDVLETLGVRELLSKLLVTEEAGDARERLEVLAARSFGNDEQKEELIERAGMDVLICVPFTREFSSLTARGMVTVSVGMEVSTTRSIMGWTM